MDTKVANNIHTVKMEPIGESKSVSSSPAAKKQVAARPVQENAGLLAPAKMAAPRVEGRKTIKAQARASQAESASKAAERAKAAAKAAANAASEALKDVSGSIAEPRKRSASLNIDGESINSNTRRKSMDDFCASHPNDTSLLDGVESAVLEGCEIAGWPDFSLDSLDAGEIDDISPGLSLPELERSSEKDGSGEAEPSTSEAQQTPSSASCKEESQKDQKDVSTSSGGKTSQAARRKGKVEWTPELHRRFVQAVEQLGVEKAIPSRILELMGVKCLTRHNIASHLQKYRSHRRHLAAREHDAANGWHNSKAAEASPWVTKGSATASIAGPPSAASHPPHIQPRPVVGIPPQFHHFNAHVSLTHPQPSSMPAAHTPAVGMPMHVWGHPTVDHSRMHMWQHQQEQQQVAAPYVQQHPAWFAPDGSVWHYAGVQYQAPVVADSWSHSPMMVQGTPCFSQHQQQHVIQQQGYPMVSGSAPVVCGPAVTGMPVSCPPQTTQLHPQPPTLSLHHAMPSSDVAPPPTPSAVSGQPLIASYPTTSADSDATAATAVSVLCDAHLSPASTSASMSAAAAVMGSMGLLDGLADEEMPNPMFPMSEDLSLDFAALSADLGEDFQESNILDAAITEALSNPLTPMPLGLKPPSVDGVLEELNKQGITMPPASNGSEADGRGVEDHIELITVNDAALETTLEDVLMAQ